MGLDNGIMIERSNALPECVLRSFDKDWRMRDGFDLEVAYWRKCWGVRSIIYNVLGQSDENDSEIGISRNDVLAVIRALKTLNKNNWNEEGSEYWSWDEYKDTHRWSLRRLKKLARIMYWYPNISVYFYDSY